MLSIVMNNPSILVTGCAGFIGSNFVKQAKIALPDTQIIGIDNFSTGRKDAIDDEIIFYEGSVLNNELLENIFTKHKPDFVFHFAALPRITYSVEYPVETTETNIVGTVTLLNAAKNHNVKRVIFSSSSSVYGGAKKMPTKESENLPDPKSPYAIQKYSSELICKNFSMLFDIDTVCLRYFTVFGPGQYGDSPYSTVIAAWLESLYYPSRKAGFIEGDGSQSRDFCYIDNVVQANLLAMRYEGRLEGDVFNIAHGEHTSLNGIIDLIKKLTGKDLVLERRPARLGDVKHTYADISKARKVLGYNPAISLKDGLEATVAWYNSRLNVSG